MRATWISTISSKTISSPPLKDTMLLLPLVTWNSPHLQAMDYMIYIKIFSFQLINAFCLNCTCAISKPYQIHIWDIYGSRTTPDASIGVVPYQTHIKSIYGPYMGHPSSPTWTLDFEPAFSPRFCFLLSPRSLFPTAQRFPIPKHVTSGLRVTSGDVTSGSGHVISASGYDVILASKRGSSCLVSPLYY